MKNSKAFTLIETLILMVAASVLLSIFLPSYLHYRQEQRKEVSCEASHHGQR